MVRTLVRFALAQAMIAGASYALVLSAGASSASAQDEYCPDCPGGHAHGHGLHGHAHQRGHKPVGGYPLAYNRAAYDQNSWDYAGPGGCRTCAGGDCQYRYYGQPDLFYNYYAWPACSGQSAALYVSPRPVPEHVGHTYITYQPLYPHEFLYAHHRTYHRYYNGGQGLNRTSVHYRASLFGH